MQSTKVSQPIYVNTYLSISTNFLVQKLSVFSKLSDSSQKRVVRSMHSVGTRFSSNFFVKYLLHQGLANDKLLIFHFFTDLSFEIADLRRHTFFLTTFSHVNLT